MLVKDRMVECMKPIQKDELYEHFRGFLRERGVELKEGSYSQTIQKSCSILADAVNLSQRGFEKARDGIDQKLDQMRQVIHEKTAPKKSRPQNAPPSNPAPEAQPTAAPVASAKTPRKKTQTRKAAAGKRKPARGKRNPSAQ